MFGLIGLYIFSILIWGLALILLILTIVYRKRKVGRWIFGSLSFLFFIAPVAFFLSLMPSNRNYAVDYYGEYVTSDQDSHQVTLELLGDKTFYLESGKCLDEVMSGTWDLHVQDGGIFIYFMPGEQNLSPARVYYQSLIFTDVIDLGECGFQNLELINKDIPIEGTN